MKQNKGEVSSSLMMVIVAAIVIIVLILIVITILNKGSNLGDKTIGQFF